MPKCVNYQSIIRLKLTLLKHFKCARSVQARNGAAGFSVIGFKCGVSNKESEEQITAVETSTTATEAVRRLNLVREK